MTYIRKPALLFLLLPLVLCGCKGKNTGSATAETRMWHIGICESESSSYGDIITDGFSDALSDELPDDSVTFTREYISDERSGDAILRDFLSDEDDMILTIGDEALSAAAAATEDIPIITTDVIDLQSAVELPDMSSDFRTGRNITGITGMPNLADQLSLAIEVTPKLKTIALVYGKGDTHSTEQIRQLRAMLDEAGLDSIIYQLGDDIDKKKIQRICDRSDAIMIPAKSGLYAHAKEISGIAAKAKVPTIGGDVVIGENTLVCLCPDYYSIGYSAGKQAAEILGRGKNPARIGVGLNSYEGIKLYKKNIAEKMDITFPKSFHEYDPSDLNSVFADR